MKTDTTTPSEFTHLPPQSNEAEQAVLGSMMIDSQAVAIGVSMLRAADFYFETHRLIFTAMRCLSEKDCPVDTLTLRTELNIKGQFEKIGGLTYLLILMDAPASAANIKYYAEEVADKSKLRQLLETSIRSQALAYDPGELSTSEIIDRAESAIFALSSSAADKNSLTPVGTIVNDELDAVEQRADNKGASPGLKTNFYDLDYLTLGLQKQELTILAARPAMGKTSLALQIALHAAKTQDAPVALFSIEMSKESVARRMMCEQAGINSYSVMTGNLLPEEWDRLATASRDISASSLLIDDTTEVSMIEIRSKCRRLKSEHKGKLALIVIDYLQIIHSTQSKGSRAEDVAAVARACKSMARELDVPVLALAQLSRGVESRPDKRPMLSDLRESGAIEAEADVVIFIYRDAYYKANKDSEDGTGEEPHRQSAQGQVDLEEAEIIVAKNRNGGTDRVKIGFIPKFTKFVNLDESRGRD